ncbi:hypothetical protein GGS23DRAFT_554002 [Durotheca rogersii]|uniref:uncharacterized protein n=1 Tax=Durotheca rogersii TaxID=419775 RepID=UPI00221E6942|nr:uncharacterized protein GGS23DRAFT_554002 [Durotheca rogersii]KAI5865737.1 hypothetical protein GGS23DRAFT_554002 [Durotheca rogersii]
MSNSVELTPEELVVVSRVLSELLDGKVQFAIMGGAACSLLRAVYNIEYRGTNDVDLIIAPTQSFNAESISNWLVKTHPGKVRSVQQFGVATPAIPISRGDDEYLVEIEIFDVQAWPNRQQYDLSDAVANPTETLSFESQPSVSGSGSPSGVVGVPVMHPKWLLREKILSQHERQGSAKERTDISDIRALLDIYSGEPLIFSSQEHVDSLQALVQKAPDLTSGLKRAVSCPQVFGI